MIGKINLKGAIEKLLAAYSARIDLADSELATIKASIREARSVGDRARQEQLAMDRRVVEARRQIVVQARADIDSLLDYS